MRDLVDSPQFAQPPPMRTSLIGREDARAEAARLLIAEAVSLLTLVGPGGVGKTRLALAAGADLRQHFADGVAWVDFAALTEPGPVAPTVAHALGLAQQTTTSTAADIAVHLRPLQMLLIFDNCEHLVDSIADLASVVLSMCPAVQILATSRAPLRIYGERELIVEPLSVPPESASNQELADSEAVRLFATRARAAGALGNDVDLAAVAAMCRRLDGLPLAIELAAANMRLFTPRELLARIEHDLPLAESGARDMPARQRTVHDSIAWSFDLLAPDDQAAFRTLSVFSGGFPIDAAVAILRPDSEAAGVACIGRLVEQSLLRRMETRSASRFAMLETVREFALKRLRDSGEEQTVLRQHAEWFLALIEASFEPLFLRWDQAWHDRLEPELDNLRAAMSWFEEANEAESTARLAGAAGPFWIVHGFRREGLDWLERAFTVGRDANVPGFAGIRALWSAATLARNMGMLERASAYANECLVLAREIGDRRGEYMALEKLGSVAISTGDYLTAQRCLEAAGVLCEALADREQLALQRWKLGQAFLGTRDIRRAIELLESSVALSRQLGDLWGTALALTCLGVAYCIDNSLELAAAAYIESLPLWRTIGSRENMAEWLAGAASAAVVRSPRAAARFFGAAEGMRAALSHAFTLPERTHYETSSDRARAVLGAAAFQAEYDAGRDTVFQDMLDIAMATLSGGPALSIPFAPAPTRSAELSVGWDLTRREREVLDLLCRRFSNAEIGSQLFIGTRTVESHVTNILMKLGATSRRDAAAIAARWGMAPRTPSGGPSG